jgi:hypothetical protein
MLKKAKLEEKEIIHYSDWLKTNVGKLYNCSHENCPKKYSQWSELFPKKSGNSNKIPDETVRRILKGTQVNIDTIIKFKELVDPLIKCCYRNSLNAEKINESSESNPNQVTEEKSKMGVQNKESFNNKFEFFDDIKDSMLLFGYLYFLSEDLFSLTKFFFCFQHKFRLIIQE